MKTIKARIKPKAAPKFNPDELGSRWNQLHTQEIALAESLEAVREAIIAATADQTPDERRHVLEGKSYTVGYLDVAGRTSLDETLLKKMLPPKVFQSLLVSTTSVDEVKLAAAVDAGTISRAIASKAIVTGKASKRLIVEKNSNANPA